MNIKRLVLGTAAGALAVTGAQAADLPVVVEPIEYVRICDAYGTGFYFIPGTETCLRVAGRVRADYQFFYDLDDDGTAPEFLASRGYDDDLDRGARFRARAYIYLDSRTSTQFGLLRTYIELQVQAQDGITNSVDLERAFIQFGGLTFGNTRSFYDFSDAYYGSFFFFVPEVSDQHTQVAAYTAAFGNGFSASISVEDSSRRKAQITTAAGGVAFVAGSNNGVAGAGFSVPDLVGNIRVDQGWGSAQVMGAIGVRGGGQILAAPGFTDQDDLADREDEFAFAVGAGVNVNVPFGQDTSVGIQGTYSHGMVSYASADFGPIGAFLASDGIIDATGDLELVDAFSVHGGASTSFTPLVSGTLGAGYTYLDDSIVGEVSSITVDGAVFFQPVAGMSFGAGLQWKYIDADVGDEASSLAGFLRAQRTF